MTEVKSEPGTPEAEKAAAASFPWPIHEAVLDNGLRVVVSPDPTTPIAAVNL